MIFCAQNIEVLNVAGPRESKEPGVYEWTLTMLRLFFNRAVIGTGFVTRQLRGSMIFQRASELQNIAIELAIARCERKVIHSSASGVPDFHKAYSQLAFFALSHRKSQAH
jgi:hypothetical protein